MTMKTPRRAMVLAAGLGKRMRPLTDTTPKPLLKVAGRTLLDRALDRLAEAKVERAVVNVHYLGEQIEAHLKTRSVPPIAISRESELLETGGGVAKALPLLGEAPFYVVNADVLWLRWLHAGAAAHGARLGRHTHGCAAADAVDRERPRL